MSPIESINLEKYNDLCACYLFLLQFAYEHDSRIIKRIQKWSQVGLADNWVIMGSAYYGHVKHDHTSNSRVCYPINDELILQMNLVEGEKLGHHNQFGKSPAPTVYGLAGSCNHDFYS